VIRDLVNVTNDKKYAWYVTDDGLKLNLLKLVLIYSQVILSKVKPPPLKYFIFVKFQNPKASQMLQTVGIFFSLD